MARLRKAGCWVGLALLIFFFSQTAEAQDLNATYTDYFTHLAYGRPLQAAESVFEDFLGMFFWGIIIGIIYIAFWIRSGNFYYPLLSLNALWWVFAEKVHPGVTVYVFVANMVGLGGIVMNVLAPILRRE